jgi:hypothetical protein
MGMNILITEDQKRILLNESIGSEIGESIKKNYEFTKRILTEVAQAYNVNIEFMLTWGTAIGGFMGPINDYLGGKNPNMTSLELSLVLTAIAATIFLDNKKTIRDILKKVNEGELMDSYMDGLKKGEELKMVFLNFINSLNVTFGKISNMLAYTFLIPILPMLYQMSSNDYKPNEIKQIAVRIISFGLVTVSSIIVREVINKIIKRFSQK